MGRPARGGRAPGSVQYWYRPSHHWHRKNSSPHRRHCRIPTSSTRSRAPPPKWTATTDCESQNLQADRRVHAVDPIRLRRIRLSPVSG